MKRNANSALAEGLAPRLSWALYDWASSGFAAVISTFVFPAYFVSQVARDPATGTSQWGMTTGLAGLVVALAGPLAGAVADQHGRRKPWLGFFTLVCVLATAALWWVRPEQDRVLAAMLLAGLATVAIEIASVFYNAMLPWVAGSTGIGRWSGWAWGLGYAGGLACLVVALFGLVTDAPWLPLPREGALHVRATFLLVAAWLALFSLPLFLFTPDEPRPRQRLYPALGRGLKQLHLSLAELRRHATIVRFLVARMFFLDGLATLFAFGGVYAAGTFGLGEQQVLLFGIALNVSAGLGAAAFARVDDRLGSRFTILVSLVALSVIGAALLLVHDVRLFWIMGTALGVFVGPVQAASRSWMGRAAPAHLRTEMFGLMAFSGKATAFLGPLLVGWLTGVFQNQRAGMSVIVVFLALGLLLMLTVPEPRRWGDRAAPE